MSEAVLLGKFDFYTKDNQVPKTKLVTTSEKIEKPFVKVFFKDGVYVGIRIDEVRNKDNESIKYASSVFNERQYQIDHIFPQSYKKVYEHNSNPSDNVIIRSISNSKNKSGIFDLYLGDENNPFLAKAVVINNMIIETIFDSTDIIKREDY